MEYRVLTLDPVTDDLVVGKWEGMFWRLRKICPTRKHAISFVRLMERQAYDRQVSILVEKIENVPAVH